MKLCIASTADQAGAKLEHLMQDSCSDGGTPDWLPRDNRVKAFIERDSGVCDTVQPRLPPRAFGVGRRIPIAQKFRTTR